MLEQGKEFVNGLNLFAYCNNPITNVDENGNAWWHWLVAAIVVVAGVVLTVVSGGAAGAAAAAVATKLLTAAATTALISGTIGFVAGGITFDKNGQIGWDWNSAIDGFYSGVLTGFIGGLLGEGLSSVGIKLSKQVFWLVQGLINGGIAATLTSIQGTIADSIISFIFGFIGGTSSIPGIKGLFLGIGLNITESIFNKIMNVIEVLSN